MQARTNDVLQQFQSTAAHRPAGCWKLPAGQAVSLQPRDAGRLRIAHGRVWLTVDGPHAGALNDLGDQVLGAGDQLTLVAGQRAVLESWDREGNASAWFSWDPLPVTVAVPAQTRWQAAVRQPLADLGIALGQAAAAFGRLLWGLAGYGEFLVAGRGRVLPRLESNAP